MTEGKGYLLTLKMESLLAKSDQVCTTPAKQGTTTNVTDRNKQESFKKLYELALKPNLLLTAFSFAIKALKDVKIIKGN